MPATELSQPPLTRPAGPRQPVVSQAAPSLRNSTIARLLRFAAANVRRRPERFVLATFGIALAIMAVTVVRTLSASFAITGDATVTRVLSGSSVWVVPAAGVHYDPAVDAIVADGPPPALDVPAGWTATRTVAGVWTSPSGPVAVYGTDGIAAGSAVLGSAAADRLHVAAGGTLDVAGTPLAVRVSGDDAVASLPTDVADRVAGANGWWTLVEPTADRGRHDLGQVLGSATGLPSTTNPAVEPAGSALIYDAVGGSGAVTFEQKFSALFSGQITSSALGLISVVGLVLGFVIAVSSFLAAVQERRREFGIMSSIGLADEVLYFFLVESALVFATAYVLGIGLAGAAVALVVPGIATVTAWLQAAGTVAAYLPAMAIVGALVPVHRLLQQRPVQLLAEDA